MQRLQGVCPCSYATQVRCAPEEVGKSQATGCFFTSRFLQLVVWLPIACVHAKQNLPQSDC